MDNRSLKLCFWAEPDTGPRHSEDRKPQQNPGGLGPELLHAGKYLMSARLIDYSSISNVRLFKAHSARGGGGSDAAEAHSTVALGLKNLWIRASAKRLRRKHKRWVNLDKSWGSEGSDLWGYAWMLKRVSEKISALLTIHYCHAGLVHAGRMGVCTFWSKGSATTNVTVLTGFILWVAIQISQSSIQ